MRKLFLLLGVCAFLSSCFSGDESENKNGEDRTYYDSDISGIVSDTTGGGDIKFEIVPNADSFGITVTRYSGEESTVTFTISDTDADAYALIEKIFNKTVDLYDFTYEPNGETGSWTTISIQYATGETVQIDNILTSGDLAVLYQYIETQITAK